MERPSCSSTRNHSVFDQPCPPYSSAWSPPESRGVDRLALDALVQLLRDVAAGALGQLLVRDQHLVHEAPGALPELSCSGVKSAAVVGRRGGGADRHV